MFTKLRTKPSFSPIAESSALRLLCDRRLFSVGKVYYGERHLEILTKGTNVPMLFSLSKAGKCLTTTALALDS